MLVFSTAARWDAIDRIWDEIFARPLVPEPTAAPGEWASGDLLTPSFWAEPGEIEAPVAVVAEVPVAVVAEVPVAVVAGEARSSRPAASKPRTPRAGSKTPSPRKASSKKSAPEKEAPAPRSRSRRKPARAA